MSRFGHGDALWQVPARRFIGGGAGRSQDAPARDWASSYDVLAYFARDPEVT
jgi:hypothetical protein